MQNRIPILIALVVGIVAVVMTNMYVSQIRQEAVPTQALVVVASADLPAGTILEAKDVSEAVRFEQSLPKLHIPWAERNLYLGQEIRTPVTAGDYILISYFGAEAGAARLSEKVDAKQSQRAFTIPVTSENSLEGSIRAGDRIDLLLTYQVPKADVARGGGPGEGMILPEFVTTTLLENIYVLATGRFDQMAEGRYKSLTLMITPDEAKLISWATKLGEMGVLLRNPKDVSPTDRARLVGDLRSLDKLGKIEIRIEDVVGQERP